MSNVEQIQNVELGGELTIFRSAELKELLLPIAERGGAVALDLSAVSDVDTAGIQLLLALKQSIEAGGGMVRLSAVSHAVSEALNLLGLEQVFAA